MTDPAPPLLNDVNEAALKLGGIGRSTLYKMMADGEIAHVKIGRRSFIAQAELERYVASLEPADTGHDN